MSEEYIKIIVAVGTLLFSGVVAAYVAFFLDLRNERRRQKFEVFIALVGNRATLTGQALPNQIEEFYRALNSLFVVFHDNKKITEIVREYRTSKSQDVLFVRLVEEISKDLKMKYIGKNDDLILHTLKPKNM